MNLSSLVTRGTATTLIDHHPTPTTTIQDYKTQTMAPINMRRYDTSTHELPFATYTPPSGRTLQQPAELFSHYRPIASHPPVIPSNSQTFPILPEQLDKHLERVQQRLTINIPTQVSSASGSAPSTNPGQIFVLNPPPGMVPTVYAFHASALGMPSMADYLRFFARYLDEMTPNKRGKALIDSELLRRIKVILAPQHKSSSGSSENSSDSESTPTSYGTGGNWNTQAFRRWVRNTFDFRPATETELERAIDFGLLSPPESSLSGPGVPGHAPSTGLTRSRNLVFHQDRPVAVRSRIYRIILRAHWITNHAGRDRTWAMVREVCSYIPKCLVYDFVAACPTCRVARSKQYGIYAGVPQRIRAGDAKKLLENLQHELADQSNKGGSDVEAGPPPILPGLPYDTPPEGWIPRIGPNGSLYPHTTQMSSHPLPHFYHPETNAHIGADPISGLPFDSVRLPPLRIPPTSVSHRAAACSPQPDYQGEEPREIQQETLGFGHQSPSWTRISSLIERAARNEQCKDVGVLTD